jgi:hypothetical protein
VVDSEKTKVVATRAAIEVGAVGLGLAIAGPAGALMAGAIKPVVELVAVREGRGLRNAEFLAQAAMEELGLSAEEFAEWAKDKEGRLLLFTSAVEAAFNTISDNKVQALAKVFRNNLGSDDKLDLGTVIVAALNDFSPAHIKVLHGMTYDEPIRLTTGKFADGVWPLSGLKVKFPSLAIGMQPILSGLERHGAAFGGGFGARSPEGKSESVWSVTDFGRTCLDYLEISKTMP